jgi:hypothetical protein
MRPADIDRMISDWEKQHRATVSPRVRREIIDDFAPQSERECIAILDTMRNARPEEFTARS